MTHMFFLVGACLAFVAVAGGAFGAHFLKSILSERALEVFETSVRYHMFHALALCLVGIRIDQTHSVWSIRAGYLFIIGVVLFSGSLYLLSLLDLRWLGAITPLGGVAFLAGWGCLVIGEYYQACRRKG